MSETKEFMKRCGLPAGDLHDLPTSTKRFPDGGQYRIEIPSTEGPQALEAVIEEAAARRVPVHRVSQGSGIMLQTTAEIRDMVRLGAEHGIEVNLFTGPRATFDIGAQAYSPAGKTIGLNVRGADQLVYSLEDTRHACELGLRSVLVSDLGLLMLAGRAKREGLLPPDLVIKTSVMMGQANPASLKVMEELGANSINVPSDLTLPQLAAIRAAISAPIDFYVEAPDNIGGFIRYYELPEIIRVAAPVYVKLGLRNAPDIYPSGTHIEKTVVALSRERVRRAQMVLEILERHCPQAVMSPRRGADRGIPIGPNVPATHAQ